MKLHILYNFRDEPWGGGNQFLKALRSTWQKQGVYTANPNAADAIIFNSYPFRAESFFDDLFELKKNHPEKLIIYRLNGPISHIRNKDMVIDRIIAQTNDLFADGIIFQSDWCAKENKEHFGIDSRFLTVIHNAPDGSIFFPSSHKRTDDGKVKLIATSWSANPRKGFDVYAFLDEHLDFSKYEMTFAGNSPIEFNNIKKLDPVSSKELAPLLREHDLFITASKTDPCSNSLIEALSCGLPAVVLNDGGHPELVASGGELFEGTQDVLEAIEKISMRLGHYRNQLPTFDITDVANAYQEFAQTILSQVQEKSYTPKQVQLLPFWLLKGKVLAWKLGNKIQTTLKKLSRN